MRDLFAEAVRLMEAGEPFALATVVETRGSTPQKAGARLLVRADGTMMGTLGGGCVEAEVWQEATTALRRGGDPSLRDFSLSDDLAAESGMLCGGTMSIFIDVVAEAATLMPLLRAVERALAGAEAAALATVVAAPLENSLGAKLLLVGDKVVGSLGDAAWNQVATAVGRSLKVHGGVDLIDVADSTRVFVEGFLAPSTMLLVGAGHIARALCPLAKRLGFQVAVLDDRPDFANGERFPEADEVIAADIAEGIRGFPVSASTAVIIATRGHKQDDVALREVARSTAGYVGLVGSRRKVLLIYRQLLEDGIPRGRLRDIHAPVGLDIGACTPEEIALSILAEVVMHRSGGTGRPLKLDEGLLQKAEARSRLAVSG